MGAISYANSYTVVPPIYTYIVERAFFKWNVKGRFDAVNSLQNCTNWLPGFSRR